MTTTAHLARSRIAKVITDAAGSDKGFEDATAALDAAHVAVVIDEAAAHSPAGQAAVLTVLNTAVKCFGRADIVYGGNAELLTPLLLGDTLDGVAKQLGARVTVEIDSAVTHVIAIGGEVGFEPFVRCWWNGWKAGLRPGYDDEPLGDAANPLSGVFAGALAVREVFAHAIGRRRSVSRPTTVDIWQPWSETGGAVSPPSMISLPKKLWFVGLGHLGQGFLWNVALLPGIRGHAVLQDDQIVREENVATGLLTVADDYKTDNHKTRVAARWLEAVGWTTSLIERRNYGDLKLTSNDPPVVLTSIDEPLARVAIARGGYEFLIDAGVGHGPVDFEIAQIRVIPKSVDAASLWSKPERNKDIESLLKRPAYAEHARKYDNCGTFELANASAAVPFVGAAIGALTIAQLLRLATLRATPQILQVELASPEAATLGALNAAIDHGLGGVEFAFTSDPTRDAGTVQNEELKI